MIIDVIKLHNYGMEDFPIICIFIERKLLWYRIRDFLYNSKLKKNYNINFARARLRSKI